GSPPAHPLPAVVPSPRRSVAASVRLAFVSHGHLASGCHQRPHFLPPAEDHDGAVAQPAPSAKNATSRTRLRIRRIVLSKAYRPPLAESIAAGPRDGRELHDEAVAPFAFPGGARPGPPPGGGAPLPVRPWGLARGGAAGRRARPRAGRRGDSAPTGHARGA